jgi:hypothetical protein
MSTATLATPSRPPAPTPPARDVGATTDEFIGHLLRSMCDADPGKAIASMERIGRSRPAPTLGFGPGHQSPADFLKTIRQALRGHRQGAAELAHLKALAAGESPDFRSPDPGPEVEAREILAATLAHPRAMGALVGLVDRQLEAWRRELAKLSPPVAFPAFKDLPPSDNPVAIFRNLKQAHAARAARLPELTALVDRVASARDRLASAYRERAAAAVASAGGKAVLTEALRESARLAGDKAGPGDGGSAPLRAELAEVDGQLARLGVDPTSPKLPVGLAAASLLERRSVLAAGIAEADGVAASTEAAGHGSLIDAATEFDPAAWLEVLSRARALPVAFPKGFEAAWSSIPLDSFIEAGAADLVEPFEAS